ncbi:VOC family protein [Actinomadura scrupuli]|uniref:VOC family protein n=1 Tax=Actinomadura scrupuli TaxID=559629 RepID=UPI003D995517
MSENLRPNIFPAMRYRDADAAVAWLAEAFGFEEKAVHRNADGVVEHAEMRLGAGLIMFGQHRPDGWFGTAEPDPLTSTVGLYVRVTDPDGHHARAAAAGAEIVRGLTDQDYGSREYSARDLEGNLWSFGTYDPYTQD